MYNSTNRLTRAWLACLAMAMLGIGACSSPPSPQPVQPLDVGIPDHVPFAALRCTQCHDRDRPAPVIDATTGAPLIHGGEQECGACHTAGGASWRIFATFSHTPTPETCLDCHSTARPTALVNQMLHAYPGVGDCVACHTTGAGVSWTSGTYNHLPSPATCAECHSEQRPSTVVNGFSHDAGGTGDCAACHRNPGTTWSGASFSHSPTPARCADCHAGTRPLGPVGTPPFDHAVAGMGDCKSCHAVYSASKTDWTGGSFSHSPAPESCNDCHLGIRPVGPVGSPAFDHAKGGTGDCVSCHQPKSVTQTDWSGGTFSHDPAPATCIGCHVGDRPAVPVGTPAFDHSIAGMGDCKACHAPYSATKTDWRGGNFDHNPAPATCIDCHLAQRPALPTASGFNHALGGTGECAACHQDPGGSWTGAVAGFDHATLTPDIRCDSCHAGDRPSAAVSVAWPGHPSSPNLFLHSVVATTDCKTCHLDAGGAWPPGTYSHSPNPGQCTICHQNQKPVGLAGNPPFDHALGGSGDCGACHANRSPTKTDWTGGTFTHTNNLPSCAGCHEYKRPNDTLHDTQGAGDCKSCHAPKSPTKTDWTGGVFNHLPVPTTCSGCHTVDKPATAVRTTGVSTDNRTYQNDYLHSQVSGDCVACHAVRSVTKTDWTGGRYNHSPVPTKCATCHNITKPGAGVTAVDHTQAGLAECNSCHTFPGQKWTGASSVPSVVVLTPPTGKTWPNITAPHPVIDSAKAGLTCATCHGTNTNAKIIDYDHAKPVAGVKCVYCHYKNQTVTSAAVETKSHESTSNTKDCNVSGCHRPSSYPSWNATSKTFSGGSWGEP